MNNLSCVFVAGLALAAVGCKKKGGGGDCATAISHSMELAKADMAKTPGMDDKMLEKMKDIGLQHCRDDKWSDDVTKCMVDAKTEADSQACYGKLSQDQQEKMNKAAMEAAQPAENTGGMGSAGSATGSDTGSAGSAAAEASAPGSDTAAGSAGSAAPPK
jgi:hypothetical protein